MLRLMFIVNIQYWKKMKGKALLTKDKMIATSIKDTLQYCI